MKKKFLECGKITSAHGVQGTVRVESWCDSPRILAMQKRVFFAGKDGSYKEARVLTSSVSGALVLMNIEGIADRESAQALKNTVIYLAREDIPLAEGAYFLADIIGLDAFDFDTGETLGKISDIQDTPAGRMYYVETNEGKTVLFPDVEEFIKKADAEAGIYIHRIPGLFD